MRNYRNSLKALQRMGHRVVVALPEDLEEEEGAPTRSIVTHKRFEFVYFPRKRDDRWSRLLSWLRPARMYAHFQQSRYDEAEYLRRRAEQWAVERSKAFVDDPLFEGRKALLRRLLAALDAVVPPWDKATEFIRSVDPDAVLIAPLLFQNTYYQNEYVRVAHALGLPVALPVFSWDNLTNKGIIQIEPDRLFVWNETQAQEAMEIHGLPRSALTVTGGMRFEQFFDQEPRTERGEYFRELDLDADRPLITYLGSSRTIAPEEHLFVQRWLEALRASPDPRVASCNILIRPHPSNTRIWNPGDFERFGNVAFSALKRNNVDGVIDAVLHSVAVVGINTTAMLEAGALDRPLFTIIDSAVSDGQTGTLHFHYLTEVGGGLVTTAPDFETHLGQLTGVLDGDDSFVSKSRAFTNAFLRPPDVTRSPVAVFVEAVDAFARAEKKRVRTPIWARPARAVAGGFLASVQPDIVRRWRARLPL